MSFTEEWLREYCGKHGLDYANSYRTPEPCAPHRPAPPMATRTRNEVSPSGLCGGHLSRQVEARAGDGEAGKTKRSKYGNRKTTRDGMTFDSEHEARVYDDFKLLWKSGKIAGFSCQVAFLLPGGVKYVADFAVLEKSGKYTIWDAKSEATRKDKVYRLKKRLMRECLGIAIQEV